MADLFREAPFGQLVRIPSGNKFFRYPEEREDFHCPHCYHADASLPSEKIVEQSSNSEVNGVGSFKATRTSTLDTKLDSERSATSSDPDVEDDQEQEPARALGLQRTQKLPYTNERLEIGKKLEVERTKFRPIRFGVNESVASLGLALYVLGYGTGPLVWAPMRFWQGFFGSPCLANGGATMQDMYSLLYLPFFVSVWVSAILAAPALGPILSGFAVVVENWRWSLWEILWLAGPVFVLWFFCLPETSASNILLRQSMRLRKLSQNPNISSQSQTDRRGLTASAIALDALIKAFEIMFKDPAVLFTNVYTALIYGIYYSFFEVFPLVYGPLYGFNIGETGVVITCIIVACVLAMGIYFYYLQYMLIPDTSKNGLRAQESRLRLALIFVWGPLIGPFILVNSFLRTPRLEVAHQRLLLGWSANKNVHWIVSVIGITIYALTVYIISQCLFVYIPNGFYDLPTSRPRSDRNPHGAPALFLWR